LLRSDFGELQTRGRTNGTREKRGKSAGGVEVKGLELPGREKILKGGNAGDFFVEVRKTEREGADMA
jgi:hypothetical protein